MSPHHASIDMCRSEAEFCDKVFEVLRQAPRSSMLLCEVGQHVQNPYGTRYKVSSGQGIASFKTIKAILEEDSQKRFVIQVNSSQEDVVSLSPQPGPSCGGAAAVSVAPAASSQASHATLRAQVSSAGGGGVARAATVCAETAARAPLEGLQRTVLRVANIEGEVRRDLQAFPLH